MKVRIAYTKKNEARYIAHLDLTRVFDRALRRAGIEVAFSEGFNPHPKISFGPPLPVGVEGNREYVDIVLKVDEDADTDAFLAIAAAKLQKQLPPGIDVIDYAVMPPASKALMAVINLARYYTEVPVCGNPGTDKLQQAFDRWMARDVVMSTRVQQTKRIERDIRPFALALAVCDNETPQSAASYMCRIDIQTGNAGSVRPVEILESISAIEGIPIDIAGVLTTREGLYIRNGAEMLNPIAFLQKQ